MKNIFDEPKRKKPIKSILLITLSLLIVLQGLFVLPLTQSTADDVTNHVSVVQNDVYVDIDQNLEDIGNRYYKMTIDAESYIKDEYRTKVQEYSEDGYHVVEKSGYYLIELWGGAGANGEDSANNPGGIGGNAGYVYGYTWLNAGQTILFTIGTDGKQAEVTEGGGGANEGGDHETWSFYKVGGGGGYSAVYLFDTTKNSFSLTENERLNNYVMIAGGGGGGGAGGNWLESTGNRPSGGNGGNVPNSSSGHLSADDNSGVAGTYFAGRDGRSSGTKTDYVGRGGTNVPGKMPTSWSGYTGLINPNDWTGTYTDGVESDNFNDASIPAGSGGMGARRGGAGGAGFCGGSGGFQSALSVSTNIGGGGGGSSFIADSITYRNLPDYVNKYLNGDNYSHVGGSCIVTYLGSSSNLESVDTTHMQNVELKGGISQYFDIQSVTASNGTANFDANGNITVTSANIAPDELGYHSNSLTVEIILKAKDNFAGGNDVPVITSDGYFTLTPSNHNAIQINTETSDNYNAAHYINVPLASFEAIGNSYMSNDTSRVYQLTELYTDNTNDIITNFDCSFLTVGAYEVLLGSTTISSTSVKVDKTTTYTVRYPVSAATTSEKAIIGAEIGTEYIQDSATITIVSADITADSSDGLNGLSVYGTKLLSHDGTNYVLNANVNQMGDEFFAPDGTQTFTSSGTHTFIAPLDGWYYMQTWGGNGGNSGSVSCTGVNGNDKRTTQAGTGGTGGYVSGYIYLTKGEVMTVTVGAAGSTGASNTGNKLKKANGFLSSTSNHEVHQSYPGGGGGYSAIIRDGTPLMVAGGGAGAGSSVLTIAQYAVVYSGGDYNNGSSVSSTISTTLLSDLSSYSGTAGQRNGSGSAKSSAGVPTNITASGGTPGTAGSNYRDSRLSSAWDAANSGVYLSESATGYAESLGSSKGTNSGGQVVITLLETAETVNDAKKLYGLTASGTISKYFDIKSLELETAFSYTNKNTVTNNDGSITISYLQNSAQIAKITYKLTPNTDGTTSWQVLNAEYIPEAILTPATVNGVKGNYITHSSSIDFVLTLSPKEGFLGGNDVPLLHYGTNGADDTGLCIEQQGATLWFPKRDSADYVNVAINYEFNDNNLTTSDATITCGESVNQANLIYSKIPLPTGADAWKADFVKVVHPATKTVSPTTTTTYDFTQQVAPKADAQKAVILDSVAGVSYTKSATVYVNYSVTTSLSNITYNGPTTIASGEGLSAVLGTNSGYLLPDSISISVGGTTLSSGNYTYNSQTGDITIAASKINGNIVITANAKILTYGIYYNYQDPVTGEQVIVKETGHGGEWAAGATINPADLVKYNELNNGVTDRVGYNFAWEWGTTDGSPITVMPAGDLYIVGLYEPIVYTVTIHYADENGNTLANDFVGKYYYQDKYSVISPQVAGYLANQTVISGTLGAENVEITVTYAKTSGQLNIIYVYGDSQTIAKETYTQSIVVGEDYAVLSPEYVGYTADKPIVSGTVTGAQAESGITIYVTYTPKNYVVSFDAAGGTLQDGDNTKTVAYNNIYGFDPTKPYGEQYYALPTPIRTGYEFIGWQDENGNLITEDTKVILSENHTLTAKWQGQLFTLTVNYYYSEVGGELAAEKFVTRVEYGTEYNFPSPYIEGYTPAPDVIGVMGAGSRVIDVIYTIDAHSITIHYVGPNGEQMANDYTAVQDYNTDYSVTSPTISGYTADQTVVSGTVGIEDIDITVNYEYIDYTLTINYLIDDETLKPETVVVEGLHIKDTYSYPSPEIIGYTASSSVVSGTVGTSNITVNVNYSRNSYILKINYIYGSDILDETLIGTTASPSVSYSLNYGAEYNYASPVIKGYFATLDSVNGVMPANDVEITVHYNQALFVSVEWGNLTFDYNQATWDADSHGYNIPPVTDGSNYVTITNSSNSSTNVDAELKYTANEGFESISGYFTRDDDNTKSNNPTCNITVGQSVKYWLWLIGTMPDELDFEKDMQTTGVCTVTIGGAD